MASVIRETIPLEAAPNSPPRPARRPEWLKVQAPHGETYEFVLRLMRSKRLHTVCEEAHCPNIGECWGRGTATFMILGDVCTRSCRFCAVKTGRPLEVDWDEPNRVAEAVRAMGLSHVVITSVNRDELPDGGATLFAMTIRRIRELVPGCTVEVLTPDFKGSIEALRIVIEARPDIFNHNVETVPRLFKKVQPQDRYEWAMATLSNAKKLWPECVTKSGIMVGLGETWEEIVEVMKDLRAVGVDILTIGQYLQPSRYHLPVEKFYHPEEFKELKRIGYELGFRWVESGPLVRSSYRAEAQARALSRVSQSLSPSL
ncbi:lipoyl synthase [Thermoflexus sp.]|uniref:lipoyl synthase n=1 Tax=Thermoflexus sp. TaxID=1969742 RepID=UPI0035E44B0D